MLYQLYKAIINFYNYDTAGVGVREHCSTIYANQAPFGSQYPMIVIQDVSPGIDVRTFCSEVNTFTILFTVSADTAALADFLGEYLYKMFHNNKLDLGLGFRNISAKFTGKRLTYDRVDKKFQHLSTYTFKIKED